MFHFSNRFIISVVLHASILLGTVPGNQLIWEGVNSFYNYETSYAISILDSARSKYPDNPLAHFTWVAAHMLHSEANYTTEHTYLVLQEKLDIIIPILKKLDRKYPDDPIYKLYLGCAIGLRARISLGRKQWLPTLINAYKGLRLIQDATNNNPDLKDALLPIGIVKYYASLNPGLIQFSLRLIGFNANREMGLENIERAAHDGEFSSIEAKKISAFLALWIEGDPENALIYSRDLKENFPRNYFFGIMLLESLIRTGKYTEAQILFKKLEKDYKLLTSIQQSWYQSYYLYELALFQFLDGNEEDALESVNKAISHYTAELDIILGNAWLLKGMIYDKMGNIIEAKKAYKACMMLDNYSAAMERANQYYQILNNK